VTRLPPCREAQGEEEVTAVMIGSLIDWVMIGILAVSLIAVLVITSFVDVYRGERAEREEGKLRHPSSRRPSGAPEDLPKAA
jgi:hypothetical protein